MADCIEVVSRKNLLTLIHNAVDSTSITGEGLFHDSVTLTIAEYPAFWPKSGTVNLIINGTEAVTFSAGWGETTLTIVRPNPSADLPAGTPVILDVSQTRVFCGVQDLALSDDFFNSLLTTPAVQIRWAGRAKQDYQGHFVYVVPIRIYYGYARNADNDGFAFENLNAAIFAAVADRTNYIGDTKGPPPSSEGVEYPEYLEDTENVTGVCVRYEMKVPFDGATN